MTSLGERLRQARIERKLELNGIAAELKISASMLKAIEEDRFDKLPGGVFARSFIRQYARLLEIDESEIEGQLTRVLEPAAEAPGLEHLAQHAAHEIPLPRMSGWESVTDDKAVRWFSSAWSLVLVVLVMLACAGAYAWWQRERRPVVAHQNPPVAAAPAAAPAAEATQSAASPPAVAEPVPPASAPPAATSAVVANAAPAAKPPAEPAEVARVTASTPAPPAIAAETNADAAVRVEVTAQEATWISVRSDGQYSFSGTLEQNQSRTAAGNQNVWVRVGNAAGVEIRLNGKAIGPIGGKGMVRTIQFTSGGFQILAPEAPKPAPPADSPDRL